MLELKIKPEAESDLGKIFEYSAMSWGVDQAKKDQDDLFAGILLLARQEEVGKEYPYTKLSYRSLHINRYLIFSRVEGQPCVVIRILHDRMDIKKHFGEGESDI